MSLKRYLRFLWNEFKEKQGTAKNKNIEGIISGA